jgi:hypothetical protein
MAVATQEQRHQERMAFLRGRRDNAVRLAAQGMRWELASRQALVRALEAAKLHAVVATNVVFGASDAQEETFCAQIDHLVITENVVIIVDSKNWQGVIFDGVRPSEHDPALGVLVNHAELGSSFSVQLAPAENGAQIRVRTYSDKASPTRQVRRQAMRFRDVLLATGTPATIRTVVFYSHPDSMVISKVEPSLKVPTVITDRRRLAQDLRKIHEQRPGEWSNTQRGHVIDTVRGLGADLVGVGRFADDFDSPVPLDAQVDLRDTIVPPGD